MNFCLIYPPVPFIVPTVLPDGNGLQTPVQESHQPVMASLSVLLISSSSSLEFASVLMEMRGSFVTSPSVLILAWSLWHHLIGPCPIWGGR